MEALIKTANPQSRIAGLGFTDQIDGDLIVAYVLHHLVIQHIAVGVFHNTDLEPQFDRNPGFAFTEPLGVWLKNRKDLFFMRYGFTVNHPPFNLLHLPLCMMYIGLYFHGFCHRRQTHIDHLGGQCLLTLADKLSPHRHIIPVRFDNLLLPFRFLERIPGG